MLENDVHTLRQAYADARDETDPFEKFNRAQGMGAVRDPYPGLAAMRAQGAVHKLNLAALMGDVKLTVGNLMAASEIYTVLSYDAVFEVLRDGAHFSSAGYQKSMGVVMGHTILGMDGEEHLRHRALLSRAFTPRAIERWESELVRPIVNEYVDRFAARGHADLVRELTFPFPVRVVAAMMGLPEEDHARFHRLAVELISVAVDWEGGGMHLARMETRVLVQTLFERLPNLRLDPEAKDPRITGLIFRSPRELPVRFDPAPASAM